MLLWPQSGLNRTTGIPSIRPVKAVTGRLPACKRPSQMEPCVQEHLGRCLVQQQSCCNLGPSAEFIFSASFAEVWAQTQQTGYCSVLCLCLCACTCVTGIESSLLPCAWTKQVVVLQARCTAGLPGPFQGSQSSLTSSSTLAGTLGQLKSICRVRSWMPASGRHS